jgi:hypothetical protein
MNREHQGSGVNPGLLSFSVENKISVLDITTGWQRQLQEEKANS